MAANARSRDSRRITWSYRRQAQHVFELRNAAAYRRPKAQRRRSPTAAESATAGGTTMRRLALLSALCTTVLAATVAVAAADSPDRLTNIEGTIGVANRGADSIRGFDATSGEAVKTVTMSPGSQPGDLAYARGKLYVAELRTPPAIAIVDPGKGTVIDRIELPAGSRPHHVHTTRSGRLVAFGMYGTDLVAVVDTCTDTLLGTWDTNAATTNGRAHAGVFAPNGDRKSVVEGKGGDLGGGR